MGSTGRTPNVYGIPATLNWCVEAIAQLKGQVWGIVQNGSGGTQNLTSVLLEGNSANNNINLTDGGAQLAIHSPSGFVVTYGDIDGTASINYLADSIVSSTNEGTRYTTLEFDQTTPGGVNIITFPDDSGDVLLDSQLGVANGIATLGGDGIVPLSQLPFGSALINKGAWNASTNTPTLIDGTGTNGDFYVVSVGATRDLGSGNIDFVAGNGVLYNGSVWQQIGAVMTATITSVSSANVARLSVVAGTGPNPTLDVVSAPKLQTARNINNIAFDGTASILLNSTYNNQTGTTYTFVLTDNQKIVTATNASPQTYTVPPNTGAGSVAFPIGTRIDVIQLGDGKVTIAGPGVTINSYLGYKAIAAKYVGVTLLKTDTNTWVLIGNLIA
jgi:hypothetical protein